jgi:hypothetical protein
MRAQQTHVTKSKEERVKLVKSRQKDLFCFIWGENLAVMTW